MATLPPNPYPNPNPNPNPNSNPNPNPNPNPSPSPAQAGYVIREGLAEGKKSHYELLLKAVLIITSVVPPELPMQTALAVNTALMALIKAGVYCTEPYRVPFAGKIDAVLFDKTGTLTTDKLVPVSVINPGPPAAGARANPATGGPAEQPVGEAQEELAV